MHLVGNNSFMELTTLWSVGKFLFLHDLYAQTFFHALDTCCCNEMMFLIALLSSSRPALLFASITYVLTSTAHLYMPQIFTHCLPTIICVTLMNIVYVL